MIYISPLCPFKTRFFLPRWKLSLHLYGIHLYEWISVVINLSFIAFFTWPHFKYCTSDCPNFPDRSVRCLSAVRILSEILLKWCPMSVCPDFSVSILSAVRILSGFKKKAVRCLSVRPDKDKKELSGLSLSLSVDVWLKHWIEDQLHKKLVLERLRKCSLGKKIKQKKLLIPRKIFIRLMRRTSVYLYLCSKQEF